MKQRPTKNAVSRHRRSLDKDEDEHDYDGSLAWASAEDSLGSNSRSSSQESSSGPEGIDEDGSNRSSRETDESDEEEEGYDESDEEEKGCEIGADDSGSNSDGESSVGDSSSGSEEEDSDEEEPFRADDNEDDNTDLPVALKLQRRLAAGASQQLQATRQRQLDARTSARQRLQELQREKRLPRDGVHKTTTKKKKSKHAPAEASSRRSDFYRQQRHFNLNASGLGVSLTPGYRPRDPRHSELRAATDPVGRASDAAALERAERDYAFLRELRDTEIAQLERRVRARSATGRTGHKLRRKLGLTQEDPSSSSAARDDQERLTQLRREKAEWERRQIDRDAAKAVRERLPKGGLHISRRKRKELLREAKYEELRKRKGDQAVEKAVARRLKKQKRQALPVDRA